LEQAVADLKGRIAEMELASGNDNTAR